jgi:tripartite-type tricarboxylate transporter receptor subunit TctC
VQDPKVRERIVADGGDPVGGTPDELGAILRADHTRWGEVVRKAGIRVDIR